MERARERLASYPNVHVYRSSPRRLLGIPLGLRRVTSVSISVVEDIEQQRRVFALYRKARLSHVPLDLLVHENGIEVDLSELYEAGVTSLRFECSHLPDNDAIIEQISNLRTIRELDFQGTLSQEGAAALSKLPLEKLTLRIRQDWYDPDEEDRTSTLEGLKNLERLRSFDYAGSITLLRTLIEEDCQFEDSLEHLRIENDWGDPLGETEMVSLGKFRNLVHLEFLALREDAWHDWNEIHPDPELDSLGPPVWRHLNQLMYYGNDCTAIAMLCRRQPQLKSVRIAGLSSPLFPMEDDCLRAPEFWLQHSELNELATKYRAVVALNFGGKKCRVSDEGFGTLFDDHAFDLLAQCPELESLHIYEFCPSNGDDTQDKLSWKSITKLRSLPQLRELHLYSVPAEWEPHIRAEVETWGLERLVCQVMQRDE
ncbi:MAG: hypothetical protein KDA88_13170 [Planctomycetaceae bacterium]|nr:hypothetical protein [Planctomycetaceae bacterium]MCB9949611.1 hypothetical protein [Planctomycetaceae bacterium]